MVKLETFSRTAADLIRLRLALYGGKDAQALVLRCYKRQGRRRGKVTEPTVLACWQEQDDALDAALGYDAPAERAAARRNFKRSSSNG